MKGLTQSAINNPDQERTINQINGCDEDDHEEETYDKDSVINGVHNLKEVTFKIHREEPSKYKSAVEAIVSICIKCCNMPLKFMFQRIQSIYVIKCSGRRQVWRELCRL